jgi:hypothetical protein
MDTFSEMIDMDKTFDDVLFDWSHQSLDEPQSHLSRTNSNADTDSDSGIGYSSNSNSPAANYQPQSNELANTTLTDNSLDQFSDLLLYTQDANEPYQVRKIVSKSNEYDSNTL